MSREDEEKRLRIRLSLFAYAYEYQSNSLISDEEYDILSKKVDLEVKTGYRKMDNFFKKHFNPDSGMWIRKHPERHKLHWLYERVRRHFEG